MASAMPTKLIVFRANLLLLSLPGSSGIVLSSRLTASALALNFQNVPAVRKHCRCDEFQHLLH
jgi:hypothetical protein